MRRGRHVHHVSHTTAISYPGSVVQRFYSLVLGPLAVLVLAFLLVKLFPAPIAFGSDITLSTILTATMHTCIRLFVAYTLSVAVAVPLAILVTSNATVEEFLLPVFDILESVPILALFPVIILIFLQFGFLNGAAIFVIFVAMLWDIVMSLVGGLKIIPKEIYQAAQAFGVRGFGLWKRVVLPALVPQLVTGSILAVAEGWNIIVVAEVLHTYIPGGTEAQDLFGIGSILVHASGTGDHDIFLASIFAIAAVIALFNIFVWHRLLKLSQRYRFD